MAGNGNWQNPAVHLLLNNYKNPPLLKTGIVQSFEGTTAAVAVEGALLTLQVADNVVLSLGLVVICAIGGRSGYVIGTMGTTIRTASGTYEGGYGNPLPPDGLGFETYVVELNTSSTYWTNDYTNMTPVAVTTEATYIPRSGGGSDGTRARGYLYYELPAELADAFAITKVEILVNWQVNFSGALSTPAISRHNYTAAPPINSSVVSGTESYEQANVTNSWVELPTGAIDELISGTAKGLAIHFTNVTFWFSGSNVAGPNLALGGGYGRLRITYQA